MGALGIDSASPAVGDRIDVKNQVSLFQNGIYTVTATGSGIAVFVMTRATDFDMSTDIKTGDSLFVTSGTVNPATTWTYTGIDNPTMGTTALTFVQSAGIGSFTSGNGITITGASVAINTAVTADLTTAQTLSSKTLTSPTLTTPALGTPASGNLSNTTADGTNAVGFKTVPQNSQSAAYTTVLTDSGKHLLHPSADTTARTFTIDSNANVAYPIGTAITFVNQASAGVMTIAITTDTMRLAGAGTTGSRTLAANGVATAVKVTATEWIISGTGLT
jgi:hypothetical protein